MAKLSRVLLALLLVLVMLLSTACTDGDKERKEPSDVKGDSSAEAGNSSDEDSDEKITVAQTVLYETDKIKVTAIGYKEGWMSEEIRIAVENHYDFDVEVSTSLLSVNGYMIRTGVGVEVAAGESANASIEFLKSELKLYGIEKIGTVQFYVEVSEAETWGETLATSELITLTTSAGDMKQEADESGDLVYDDNGIRIFSKGLYEFWGGSLVFFMENNSGQSVTVFAEDIYVNGVMVEAGLWTNLRDGTMSIDWMELMSLEELDIDSIQEIDSIQLKFCIVNHGTWDEIDSTDTITLTF